MSAASPKNESESKSELELGQVIASIGSPDPGTADLARAHHLRLTKPPGSLGRLEALGVQLATISGSAVPPGPEPATVVVFAGDHGVLDEGVTPWPQEVTAQMVANICGGGAAINVIAKVSGIEVLAVNAGVATALPEHPRLINDPVRLGTDNLRLGPAMSRDEAAQGVMLGRNVGRDLVAAGCRCLLTGDMGIGNTTPSAAVIAALVGADAAVVTGRGTGIDDKTLGTKMQVIDDALNRTGRPGQLDGLDVLAELGGLEIAGLAGLCIAGAEAGIPVLIDGVISLAGAMIAARLAPSVVEYLLAGHRSVEPAATLALEALGLDPILELELRLGEGTGAALAYPVVVSAARVMAEMATFDSAGIDS